MALWWGALYYMYTQCGGCVTQEGSRELTLLLGFNVEGALIVLDGFEELGEVALAKPAAPAKLAVVVLGGRLARLDGPRWLVTRVEATVGRHIAAQALDNLEEEGGPVADGLGEDLEEDSLVILVDEDAEVPDGLELLDGERALTDARLEGVVVCVAGSGHEVELADIAHLRDRCDGIVALERKVLEPSPAVVFKVRLDLALSPGPKRWLVDRQ